MIKLSHRTTSYLLARDAIESMRDAVLSIDQRGTIIMLNPAAEQLLQVNAEEIIGRSFAQTFIERADLENLNDCILQAIYDPTTSHTAEIRVKVDDGPPRHLVVRSNLLTSEAGQSVGVVTVIADISEQVRLLEQQLDNAKTQQQFGQFFIYSLGVMSIGMIVNNLIARSIVDVNIYTQAFAWQYLLVLLIPSLMIVKLMGLSLRDVGLSSEGLRRSFMEGMVVSIVAIALTAALAGTLHHLGRLPGKPVQLIDLEGLLTIATYFMHSFFQEIVARGFLQNAFQRFLNDEKGAKSVLLTSAFFGLFHIHFGFTAVILTAVSGVAFGFFYLHNKNIAGVTLIHFTTGICAFASGLI
ncbi:MAG: PAS domain-containing protein [Gammaproteobacteria bacterium]|nr:PAS domain-containing protein [Gammaproteobacteria bacterium]